MTKSYGKSSGYKKPYKKRYYKSKNYVGKSIYKFAKELAAPGANLAVNYIKNRLGLNTESKWIDTTQSGYAVTTTLAFGTYAQGIPEGADQNSRNGSNVRMTSYYVRGLITPDVTSALVKTVRIIVIGKKVVDTALVVGDILTSTTGICSPYSMDTEGYTIFYDRLFTFAAGTNAQSIPFIIDLKPMNWHLKWSDADTTGTNANMKAGSIRIAYMCDSATTPPTIQTHTRMKIC